MWEMWEIKFPKVMILGKVNQMPPRVMFFSNFKRAKEKLY